MLCTKHIKSVSVNILGVMENLLYYARVVYWLWQVPQWPPSHHSRSGTCGHGSRLVNHGRGGTTPERVAHTYALQGYMIIASLSHQHSPHHYMFCWCFVATFPDYLLISYIDQSLGMSLTSPITHSHLTHSPQAHTHSLHISHTHPTSTPSHPLHKHISHSPHTSHSSHIHPITHLPHTSHTLHKHISHSPHTSHTLHKHIPHSPLINLHLQVSPTGQYLGVSKWVWYPTTWTRLLGPTSSLPMHCSMPIPAREREREVESRQVLELGNV